MQCPCGSRSFLGRRCVICNEDLTDEQLAALRGPSFKARKLLQRHSWVLVIPFWALFLVLLVFSKAAWETNSRGQVPATTTAFIMMLATILYLGAPLVTFFGGRHMRAASAGEVSVAVMLVRLAALSVFLYLGANMLLGWLPGMPG
jgi:hypothetical protein